MIRNWITGITLLGLEACSGSTEPPPVASRLVVTAIATSAKDREPFGTPPVVQLQDNTGRSVATANVAISAAVTTGGAQVFANGGATTDVSGAAVFSGLSLAGIAGVYTVVFSSPGLADASATVELTAGAPAMVETTSPASQGGQVDGEVPVPPSIRVSDADSNAVEAVGVTFEVAQGNGQISGADAHTDSQGVAAASKWVLGHNAGPNEVRASVLASGVMGNPVVFNAYAFPRFQQVTVQGSQSPFATGVTFNRTRGRLTLVYPGYGVAELDPNGGTWSRLATSAPAMGRVYAAVHEASQRILIISDDEGPSFWDYQTQTWSQAGEGDVPAPRLLPAMVYDSIHQRVLLYGGIISGGSSNPVADVYSWDGARWTRLDDSPAGPRAGHRMAYDPATGSTWVVGGTDLGNPFGGRAAQDTWVINNGGTWHQLDAPLPEPLAAFGMAYDEHRRALVIAGGTQVGVGGYGLSNRVWEFLAGSWVQSASDSPVGARVLASVVYAPSRAGLLVYGSEHAGWNDLWFYGDGPG